MKTAIILAVVCLTVGYGAIGSGAKAFTSSLNKLNATLQHK